MIFSLGQNSNQRVNLSQTFIQDYILWADAPRYVTADTREILLDSLKDDI